MQLQNRFLTYKNQLNSVPEGNMTTPPLINVITSNLSTVQTPASAQEPVQIPATSVEVQNVESIAHVVGSQALPKMETSTPPPPSILPSILTPPPHSVNVTA